MQKLDPHGHIGCWLYVLYLECGSHFSSEIYVKYVCGAPYCLVDAIDLICIIYVQASPTY